MVGGIVAGGLVEISELENLVVIGDLHGDSKLLYGILAEIDYDRFLSNPLNKLVFLGDYVDRGSDSIGVVYSICYLKCKYPNSIILMKGNHEAPVEFPFASHNLPYELEQRFGSAGKDVYRKLLEMFRLLCLAVVVNQRLLLVHGGVPTENMSMESVMNAQENHIQHRTLEEILWNDPREIDIEPGWEKSRRGLGRHFGRSITRKWLELSNTRTIVRGHEPCQGFRLDHGDTVLTLFSCREAYPKFRAAYILLELSQLGRVNNAMDLSRFVKFPA